MPESVQRKCRYHGLYRFLRYVAQLGGRWTDEDASALRATLASLTTDQRSAILDPLIIALNQETIQLETSGPPFQGSHAPSCVNGR